MAATSVQFERLVSSISPQAFIPALICTEDLRGDYGPQTLGIEAMTGHRFTPFPRMGRFVRALLTIES